MASSLWIIIVRMTFIILLWIKHMKIILVNSKITKHIPVIRKKFCHVVSYVTRFNIIISLTVRYIWYFNFLMPTNYIKPTVIIDAIKKQFITHSSISINYVALRFIFPGYTKTGILLLINRQLKVALQKLHTCVTTFKNIFLHENLNRSL